MSFLGLGAGMDLSWNSARGFQNPSLHDSSFLRPATRHFLDLYGDDFSAFFFSFQRRTYGGIEVEDYLEAFAEMAARARRFAREVNLHHTLLNLASSLNYNRGPIVELTNRLHERCRFGWVNEDMGIWFLNGKSLPYPLPPILTRDGLRVCVENTREVMSTLAAPLSIEFPGFTEGASFYVGDWDAFEFFADLADQTSSLVTLDTGHLIGWEYSCGRQGDEMYRHLENFPYDQVVEIHLSGSELRGGKFYDRHHGILLPEQIAMLDFLLPRCRHLKVVTYEDPQYNAKGELIEASREGYRQLKERVKTWKSLPQFSKNF